MAIHFILTSAGKHETQYTIRKLTTICLVGDARSTRIGQNARVHGKDVRHSEECCRRACKFGSKCASSFLSIEVSKGIIRRGRCMHHVDENNVIFHHIVLADLLMISYLYLEESTNKRSINGIVQFICKLHDRPVYQVRYPLFFDAMRCDEER